METFNHFIGGTAGFLIFTAFGALALRGAWVTYNSGHYFASISGLFLGLMWLYAGLLSGHYILIPWLFIGSALLAVWFWQQSPTTFKRIIEGIFGWVIILLVGGGIIIPIFQVLTQ